ncbi:tetratricopeptide repeat protein [Streptomyces sp. NPDC006733]|uniref:tetratricopeptide repeat protein n=1 Tax=Streptomyces sp. NPDC006733 TaxID=3155460 RepID=UPI0033D79354
MPRRHQVRTTVSVLALTSLMTAGALVHEDGAPSPTAHGALSATDTVTPQLTATDVATRITALQQYLQTHPRDPARWATLSAAYIEQARTTGDSSRYPQAGDALSRSLALQPRDNDAALAGYAALAAARHDFQTSLRYADAALAVNPYGERALAVRIDALVELGRYDEALAAAQHADAVRPGIPAFTRLAYVRELRGDTVEARRILILALKDASTPAETAYSATALGNLAWAQGRYDEALAHYATALRADPQYLPALEGRGRTRASRGDLKGALRDLTTVVQQVPLPAELTALGETYQASGNPPQAQRQFALVAAWSVLAQANGVATDLDTAVALTEHGNPMDALAAAHRAWDQRHTVHTADALAWALHARGQDAQALPYAQRSLATGYRNATFRYHLAIIEMALGRRDQARVNLRSALALNPGFSPTGAPAARAALTQLDRLPEPS